MTPTVFSSIKISVNWLGYFLIFWLNLFQFDMEPGKCFADVIRWVGQFLFILLYLIISKDKFLILYSFKVRHPEMQHKYTVPLQKFVSFYTLCIIAPCLITHT